MPEIIRFSTHPGGLAPRAVEVLSRYKEESFYHFNHDLRHPLSIYNLSLNTVWYGFEKILDELEKLATERNFVDDKSWVTELLMRQRLLLYFLMEHIEHCFDIFQCFFKTREEQEDSGWVRRFKKRIKPYRDHIATVVNHIKHHQGMLAAIVLFDDNHVIPGYFIEGFSNGVIGPSVSVHKEDDTAFSFGRDLRLHFYWLYLLSEYLSDAIEGILGESSDKRIGESTNDFQVYSIASRIINLSPYFYLNELKLDRPSVKTIIESSHASIVLACPDKSGEPEGRPTKLSVCRVIIGDGVSKTFRLPFMTNDDVQIF